jgi:uroporphyrinogen decarboxylase
MMTSRQRVHAALRREATDRIPIFMWFHPETVQRLACALEIPAESVPDVLGNDVRQTWVGNNASMEGVRLPREGDLYHDPWGITWVREGPFNQLHHSPLQGADDATVAAYRYPVEAIPALLARLDPLLADASSSFLGVDVSPCVFEMVNRLRGMEEALLDLVANPELAFRMAAAAADFAVQLAEAALRRHPFDWLWTGDDVGGQESMLMSPESWRTVIKPHLARVVQVGRDRGVWVAYHSCGAIRPIIPDLIEIGVQVLNPIQTNCPGMDPFELKREYGAHLAFMGGLDTQELLPRASAAEVYRETRRLIEGMTSDGGGYILAASHTVPPETPLENIFAMYEASGLSCQAIYDSAADIRARRAHTCRDRSDE